MNKKHIPSRQYKPLDFVDLPFELRHENRIGFFSGGPATFAELLCAHCHLRTKEEASACWLAQWEECASLADLEAAIESQRDEKRRLSPDSTNPRVKQLSAALKQLQKSLEESREATKNSNKEPYENPQSFAPWKRRQVESARLILRQFDKLRKTLRPLYEQFPHDREELDKLDRAWQQLIEGLWEWHLNLIEFIPKNNFERWAMRDAIAATFGLDPRNGMSAYLKNFEADLPSQEREIILLAFDDKEGSTFDPRRYQWYEDEVRAEGFADLAGDIARIETAVSMLSPLGQSFFTAAALQFLLLRASTQRACFTIFKDGTRQYKCAAHGAGRPIICEMDFTGKPAVTPRQSVAIPY